MSSEKTNRFRNERICTRKWKKNTIELGASQVKLHQYLLLFNKRKMASTQPFADGEKKTEKQQQPSKNNYDF